VNYLLASGSSRMKLGFSFICEDCGKIKAASHSLTLETKFFNLEGLVDSVQNARPVSDMIPIGWENTVDDKSICAVCSDKRRRAFLENKKSV
jgi:hypothetical protein